MTDVDEEMKDVSSNDVVDEKMDESEDEKEEEEDSSQMEMLKNRGNELFKAKRYEAAIEMYSSALNCEGGEEEERKKILTNRAAAKFYTEKYDDVIEDCDAAIRIDGKWKKAWNRKGQALRALGHLDQARSAYQSLLEIDPKSTTAQKGMKQVDSMEKKFSRAETLLEKGKFKQAYDAAVEIMKTCSDAPRMHKVKLNYMISKKMYDEVVKYSTFLLRKKIDGNDVLLIRAQAFYWNSNFSLCMKHLQQVLRRDPDYRPAQKQLKQLRKLEKTKLRANQMFKRSQWEEAVKLYTMCLKIEPDHKMFNSKILCNRAAALQKLRRNKEALDDCNQAIAFDTKYTKAYLRRAQCFFDLGGEQNLEYCIRDYERVIEKYSRGDAPRDIQQRLHRARIALKRAKRKDYYKILGVPHNATEKDIRKAYRKKAMKWHPDRHTTKSENEKKLAEKNFKDINEANDALSDPQKRARYDAGEDDLDGPSGGGHGGMHPNDIFAQMFHGGGGGFGGGFGGGGGGFHRGGGFPF